MRGRKGTTQCAKTNTYAFGLLWANKKIKAMQRAEGMKTLWLFMIHFLVTPLHLSSKIFQTINKYHFRELLCSLLVNCLKVCNIV